MVFLQCQNGQSYTEADRCLYNQDPYGALTGCRDATHLQNCGKLGGETFIVGEGGRVFVRKIFPYEFYPVLNLLSKNTP